MTVIIWLAESYFFTKLIRSSGMVAPVVFLPIVYSNHQKNRKTSHHNLPLVVSRILLLSSLGVAIWWHRSEVAMTCPNGFIHSKPDWQTDPHVEWTILDPGWTLKFDIWNIPKDIMSIKNQSICVSLEHPKTSPNLYQFHNLFVAGQLPIKLIW